MNWKALCLIAGLALTVSLSACASGGDAPAGTESPAMETPAPEASPT